MTCFFQMIENWDWNGFRYNLFTETGEIISVICLLLAVILFFVKSIKFPRIFSCLAMVIMLPIGEDMFSVNPDKRIVEQMPEAGTIQDIGTPILLSFTDENVLASTPDTNENSNLTLEIIDYSVFKNGYYYEYPDPENPEMTCFIDFNKGIYGSYQYSRALNEAEESNWSHTGRLCDANGKEVVINGKYPSFWAVSNGKYAVEFPEGMAAGTYTYELILYVDGQIISDSIRFEVE